VNHYFYTAEKDVSWNFFRLIVKPMFFKVINEGTYQKSLASRERGRINRKETSQGKETGKKQENYLH
jgi:hypothetical protein